MTTKSGDLHLNEPQQTHRVLDDPQQGGSFDGQELGEQLQKQCTTYCKSWNALQPLFVGHGEHEAR